MTKIFCYGTLKRGYGNWARLLNGRAEFLGAAVSLDKRYVMWGNGFPILCESRNGTGSYVKGELFNVPRVVLTNLDVLEGHPNWYRREPRKFFNLDTLRVETADVYLQNVEDRMWRSQRPRIRPKHYVLEWNFKERKEP